MLENRSGIGFDAVIKKNSASLSGCNMVVGSSGLPIDEESQSPYYHLQYTFIPAAGSTMVTVSFMGCQTEAFRGTKSANVGLSLVIRVGETTFVLPVSAANVPVRLGGFL
jgi:hypothetical protein